jgi:hypothetical protein
MPDGSLAKELLNEAAVFFDAPGNGLAQSADNAARKGFASAGEWMRGALGVIRNEPVPDRGIRFHWLGLAKYVSAAIAAMAVAILGWWTDAFWMFPLAILLFYAVEAQMIFLFPLAMDGSQNLMRESLRWTRRAGGTWDVMKTVLPVAAAMLLGGFFRKGFVRSWCLGCLAVLIWYERLRNTKNSVKISRPRLEIGVSQPLQVRTETLRIFNQSRPFRLFYASDLHLKGENSRLVAEQIISAARECAPDLILLGGDLVDTNAGLPLLTRTVAQLSGLAATWAVAGNHDAMVGMPLVQSAVENGLGNWLENRSVLFGAGGQWPFFLDGHIAIDVSANHPRILCAHNPGVFPKAAESGYSLVLAGHLHGGQFVLKEKAGRFFPAAWFYRWNGLRFALGASTMLVSRGASDTLPLRWNCPREILLCELY